jgi:hypothetical protein
MRNALLAGLGITMAFGQSSPSTQQPSAEDGPPSLGSAARNAKPSKPRVARVFTDEDMEVRRGPIPRLNLDGVENSDEILEAINKYRVTHKPEEVEQAIHDWYDEYDTLLNAAIKQDNDYRNLRQANIANGYELCQQSGDYEKCEQRRQAEMRGARLDNQIIRDNGLHSARLQQGLIKVRNGLNAYNLHYMWFKIRQGNGNGSF